MISPVKFELLVAIKLYLNVSSHILFLLSGHTRYSTAGVSEMTNCQPFVVETLHGLIALGHNGELVNANPLKQKVFLQIHTPSKRIYAFKIMQDAIYNFCSKSKFP